jgi:plasmid maintenance system killer protein
MVAAMAMSSSALELLSQSEKGQYRVRVKSVRELRLKWIQEKASVNVNF